ncbi:HVO_0649 family zinc finger protein [Haloplanus ruber]|uniref:HVO_0649 family zinc finger protein n=1 Tax=Haloplanus ruber TaxID=869892 RepID=A0ABD6CUG1_9EURY|nr:HVO_0649 family zinc finger protein [Haloplanus ruber]
MSTTNRSGSTPFARLRAHLEASRAACPACGFEDPEAEWRATTTGRRIAYRHRCPSCDAVDERALTL